MVTVHGDPRAWPIASDRATLAGSVGAVCAISVHREALTAKRFGWPTNSRVAAIQCVNDTARFQFSGIGLSVSYRTSWQLAALLQASFIVGGRQVVEAEGRRVVFNVAGPRAACYVGGYQVVEVDVGGMGTGPSPEYPELSCADISVIASSFIDYYRRSQDIDRRMFLRGNSLYASVRSRCSVGAARIAA